MSTPCTKRKDDCSFGRHRDVDHFIQVEFQHRDSLHAHVFLCLENAPAEDLAGDMPLASKMITDLCSVDEQDLMDSQIIRNQTLSPARSGANSNVDSTFIIIGRCINPEFSYRSVKMIREELYSGGKRRTLVKNWKPRRGTLSRLAINCDIDCEQRHYLDLIRSTLKRQTILLKRYVTQIYINTFHSLVATEFSSNMNFQIMSDLYSCANYVVDYVNKSNRGISHLHRQLLTIHEEGCTQSTIKLNF